MSCSPADSPPRTNRRALAALLAGAAAIAFSGIFVRLSELAPSATAFWRVGFALPVLLIWMVLEGRGTNAPRQPSSVSDYLRLSLAGLCFAGDLATWHWSLTLTSVADATLLANLAPVFVTLAGWLWLGQSFSRVFLTGLALAMTGVLVLMGDSARIDAEHLTGDLVGMVTAMFYAGYLLAVGRLREEFSTATIMAWTAAITAVALVPIAALSGETLIATSPYGWGILLALALFSHCGGQSLITYALAHLPAAFGAIGLLFQPAVAIFLAWGMLGEAPQPWQAVGALIILCGIALARHGSH